MRAATHVTAYLQAKFITDDAEPVTSPTLCRALLQELVESTEDLIELIVENSPDGDAPGIEYEGGIYWVDELIVNTVPPYTTKQSYTALP